MEGEMQQKCSKHISRHHVVAASPLLAMMLIASGLTGCSEADQTSISAPPPIRPFEQLVADMKCNSCHLPGNKMGAPSWKDVAKKYKKEKLEVIEQQLTIKISRGGSGAWGRMDMPPHPELKQAELKVLALGILTSNNEVKKPSTETQKK
jgi:cytochrome c